MKKIVMAGNQNQLVTKNKFKRTDEFSDRKSENNNNNSESSSENLENEKQIELMQGEKNDIENKNISLSSISKPYPSLNNNIKNDDELKTDELSEIDIERNQLQSSVKNTSKDLNLHSDYIVKGNQKNDNNNTLEQKDLILSKGNLSLQKNIRDVSLQWCIRKKWPHPFELNECGNNDLIKTEINENNNDISIENSSITGAIALNENKINKNQNENIENSFEKIILKSPSTFLSKQKNSTIQRIKESPLFKSKNNHYNEKNNINDEKIQNYNPYGDIKFQEEGQPQCKTNSIICFPPITTTTTTKSKNSSAICDSDSTALQKFSNSSKTNSTLLFLPQLSKKASSSSEIFLSNNNIENDTDDTNCSIVNVSRNFFEKQKIFSPSENEIIKETTTTAPSKIINENIFTTNKSEIPSSPLLQQSSIQKPSTSLISALSLKANSFEINKRNEEEEEEEDKCISGNINVLDWDDVNVVDKDKKNSEFIKYPLNENENIFRDITNVTTTTSTFTTSTVNATAPYCERNKKFLFKKKHNQRFKNSQQDSNSKSLPNLENINRYNKFHSFNNINNSLSSLLKTQNQYNNNHYPVDNCRQSGDKIEIITNSESIVQIRNSPISSSSPITTTVTTISSEPLPYYNNSYTLNNSNKTLSSIQLNETPSPYYLYNHHQFHDTSSTVKSQAQINTSSSSSATSISISSLSLAHRLERFNKIRKNLVASATTQQHQQQQQQSNNNEKNFFISDKNNIKKLTNNSIEKNIECDGNKLDDKSKKIEQNNQKENSSNDCIINKKTEINK
ncbi:putative uncharacterized protein DDB_G0277255 isoform X2 [Condylostylus longicornis]|uniref:putative uncharacterized protein DDB_G0277255 isoform X2 n=1 Tax=Condylostylus longicornis TaxID=2530218 RepID=UPI00244DA7CA|nr:putative uncharacterized protein DDB_G0277255 isoform X2 [Condylostylus longicornis]